MATTGRTTPASKAKKTPAVQFDIEAAESELDDDLEEMEPFVVNAANGTPVTFVDVRKLDTFVASTLDFRDPYSTFRILIEDPDEYAAFTEKGFSQHTGRKLIKRYQDYYKVLDQGN